VYDVSDKLYDVRYNVYDVCGKTRAKADNVYDMCDKMSAEGDPVVLEGVLACGEGDIVGFYYFPGCGIPITALKTAILLGGCFEFLFFA
jgi:hypothetical protein